MGCCPQLQDRNRLNLTLQSRIVAYSITEIKTGIVTNGYKSLGFDMLHKYVVYLENMIK